MSGDGELPVEDQIRIVEAQTRAERERGASGSLAGVERVTIAAAEEAESKGARRSAARYLDQLIEGVSRSVHPYEDHAWWARLFRWAARLSGGRRRRELIESAEYHEEKARGE